MLHLFTVEDTFEIEQRGCVLVPGLPTEPGAPVVRTGARIRLRTPLGRDIDTTVKAIELVNYRKHPDKICIPVLLPRDVTKSDVPTGTQVYLLEETYDVFKQPGT